MELYTKEQFGPVVPVCAYQDEQEFLDYVTQSNYGQQVSLFGRDPDKFVKLIDPLANQVCRIRRARLVYTRGLAERDFLLKSSRARLSVG